MSAPLAERVARFVRRDVQSMHAYAIQPSDGLVKLDAMENPYRLPTHLRRALGERLADVALNRYPGARMDVLRAALARHAGVPDGCGLVIGNGSDELITLLSMVCDLPGASVLAPVPGFVMYAMAARLQGLEFVGVPLTADFQLDERAMLEALERPQPAIVYLAYPNNPTANLWDEGAIERIVRAAPGFVVMDEAYQPFASRDSMSLLRRHEHVLIMRTMSKFGLAGVRIGYLIGRRTVVDEVEKVRPPYNVSVLNCEAALFALEHADEYAKQAEAIRADREALLQALRELPGLTVFPSDANMILVRLPKAAQVFEGMKSRGVLVKHVAGLHPLLADCLRLTVGTPEENQLMLQALKASL